VVSPSPWGELIDRRRRERGLGIDEVVALSGLSDTCWRENLTGQRRSGGRVVRVGGKPNTIARMAFVVGVEPDELEALGSTPEWTEPVHLGAARALRHMLDDQRSGAADHEDWLRLTRQRFDTLGGFLDYVLGVTGDSRRPTRTGDDAGR
jgi:hypothetical protein